MRENYLWKALYMISALSGILAGYGMFTLAGKTPLLEEAQIQQTESPGATETDALECHVPENATVFKTEPDSVEQPVPDVELNLAEQFVPDVELNLVEQPVPDGKLNLVEQPVLDGELNLAEQPVPDGELNLAEQPVPDAELNLAEQPVPDGKLNLVEQPVPDGKLNLAEQPVPDGKLNLVEQPVPDGKLNLVEQPVPDAETNSAEQPVPDAETNSAEWFFTPTQISAQTDTTMSSLATETFNCPVEIFGQVPEFTPSDEYVSYFEFAYELVTLCEPLIKERELNLNALLARFVVKAFFCGVDVERLDINAPIPRRLAALCLWLAAKVLEEEGCDTRAQNVGKYATDAGNCSRSEKKALVYLYEQGISEADSLDRKFYPEEGLRTESAARWLARIKECWN